MTSTTTRITTPFGFSSTAAEVIAGIDLSGKRAIVTGGASGIGIETARALASAGADVTIAVRNVDAAGPVAADITATTHNPNVHIAHLDLADRASIQSFASAWTGPLHILINNAGVMACPEEHTPEGWELQFATNHLGHFLLSHALHDALAEGAPARIVSVSSTAHFRSPVIFDDLHFAFRTYEPFEAYGQSKTANILFAVEATNRWAADGIFTNALMPGAIPTNLQRHIGGSRAPQHLRKNPQQGAATSVLVATTPLLEGIGGRYFCDCNEALIVSARTDDMTGVAPYALDPSNAARLWDVTLDLLNLA